MFSDPEKNIAQFGLGQGMHVADLGSGTGFYSFAAGRRVGQTGKVFAIDVQQDLLTRLKNQAESEGLSDIEIVRGDIEKPLGTRLRDHSVDAVIIANTLFQVEHKIGCVEEMKRILKPKGRALVIDWTESFGGMGPQSGNILSQEQAQELFLSAGFTVEKTIDAGAHHYGIIFIAP